MDLWGSNGAPSSLTSPTSDAGNNIPTWMQDYTRGLAEQATKIAGNGYQGYNPLSQMSQDQLDSYGNNSQIAPWNAFRNDAANLTQGNVGSYQPYMQQAQNSLGQAGASTPSQINNYMSPYIQDVNNATAQLAQRNLQENLLPSVNSTFTGAGQFGSTRNAEFENRALRDTNQTLLQQQAQNLQQGYNMAGQQFSADANRDLNVGATYGNLGNLNSQLGYKDAAAMDTMGQEKQNQQQQNYNLAYQDFLQQRDYSQQQLDWLNSMVRGLQYSNAGYNTQANLNANPVTTSPLSAITTGYPAAMALTSPSYYPTNSTSSTTGR